MPSDELESDLLLLSSLCRQQLRQEQTHVSRRWPSAISPGTGRGQGWGRGQSGWSLTASSLSTPSRAPEVLSSETGLFAWPACPAPGALPAGLLIGGPAPLRAADPWAGEVTPGAHLQGHPDQENRQVRLWGWTVSLPFNNVYWTEEKGKWDEEVRSVFEICMMFPGLLSSDRQSGMLDHQWEAHSSWDCPHLTVQAGCYLTTFPSFNLLDYTQQENMSSEEVHSQMMQLMKA